MTGISDMSALRAEMCEAITAAPLCKNCDHCGMEGRLCCRPIGTEFDLIRGEQTQEAYSYLWRERKPTSLLDRLFGRTRCGPRGLYFKPRERPTTPPPPCGGNRRLRALCVSARNQNRRQIPHRPAQDCPDR